MIITDSILLWIGSYAATTQEQLPNKIFLTCLMQYWPLLDITVEGGGGGGTGGSELPASRTFASRLPPFFAFLPSPSK